MKKFGIYSLIVLTVVASISMIYIFNPIIPEAEAIDQGTMCAAGCLALAILYCKDCTESQIAAVAFECMENECN